MGNKTYSIAANSELPEINIEEMKTSLLRFAEVFGKFKPDLWQTTIFENMPKTMAIEPHFDREIFNRHLYGMRARMEMSVAIPDYRGIVNPFIIYDEYVDICRTQNRETLSLKQFKKRYL